MKKTALLQKYILEPEILVMPGAHDVLSARIIEKAGFKALAVGGYSATYALAKTVSALMAELSRTGTTKGFWDQMWQFDDFYQFMGVDALRQKERNYHERGMAAVAVEQLQSKQVFSRSKSKRRRKS